MEHNSEKRDKVISACVSPSTRAALQELADRGHRSKSKEISRLIEEEYKRQQGASV